MLGVNHLCGFGAAGNSNGDPYISNVVLLMHMEGSSTTFTDEKGKVFTRLGDAQLTAATKKFGTSSLRIDPVDDCIETFTSPSDFAFGTGDFTLEAWIYLEGSSGSPRCIFNKVLALSSGNVDFRFGVGSNGELTVLLGPTLEWTSTPNGSVPYGQWVHVAATRASGVVYLFVGGVLLASRTVASDIGNVKDSLRIGLNQESNWEFNGYIDEARITNGVARYTDSFSVPTMAFPNS